jgi:hypothetical protein
MNDKNSVKFTGDAGLLFTDEKGVIFCVYTQTLPFGQSDMVLYSKEIRRIGSKRELTDNEREMIISKILELTPHIKWQIQS